MNGGHVLAVRLDALGDVLVCGPALRALAAGASTVTALVGRAGAAAARLSPGVDDVLVWDAPWVGFDPTPVSRADTERVIDAVARRAVDEAVVFTSFHQSPLPAALLLRLAGVRRISAICADYPGTLLDVRHRVDEGVDRPETERALDLARAAGFSLPQGDDGRLAVRRPLPNVRALTGATSYVVLHPAASVQARSWSPARCAQAARALGLAGHRVLVTGGRADAELTAYVATRGEATDLGGRTDVAELAAVLAGARVAIAPNTGPAHLAAAVGTPVVSLFAPVVPAARWAPYGVPTILLGDQAAACAGTRSRQCPLPGHPCLESVTAEDVVVAVDELLVKGTSR
ncbi:glycosyltransferase family 9 protein [Streptomyces sp. SID3343]|uniref:glycosyltransferase family 9 protein n=1 Tax=Streptomyces sp. SID3343 TaxID=2690260 RepID=UPI00136FAB4F|nr:glycosyltransferase family 9 protein [Streptomyces sp. SID3343]MYW01932.1 glycosyltransferase family 9 protein [Streptomyces sp. SID3343]